MGDLLGSLRVAPLSFALDFFAGVIAYGDPARSLYLHPFLFLRIFFC